MTQEPGSREESPRGYGPVMTADDGTKYQVTEDDVWNAMPFMAAFLIVMAALDFSRHEEWMLGDRHVWFGSGFRLLVRITGFSVAGLICLMAWRDAKRREREDRSEEDTRELAGRAFVSGKRPGEEP